MSIYQGRGLLTVNGAILPIAESFKEFADCAHFAAASMQMFSRAVQARELRKPPPVAKRRGPRGRRLALVWR